MTRKDNPTGNYTYSLFSLFLDNYKKVPPLPPLRHLYSKNKAFLMSFRVAVQKAYRHLLQDRHLRPPLATTYRHYFKAIATGKYAENRAFDAKSGRVAIVAVFSTQSFLADTFWKAEGFL